MEDPPVEQPPKRKRGRPPKTSRPPTVPVKSPHHRPGKVLEISSNNGDGSESEGSGSFQRRRSRLDSFDLFGTPQSSIRRSNRGKKLDTSRPLIVLLPDVDPRSVLDIRSEAEWNSFQVALTRDVDPGDLSDSDPGHGSHSDSGGGHVSNSGSANNSSSNSSSSGSRNSSSGSGDAGSSSQGPPLAAGGNQKVEVHTPRVTERKHFPGPSSDQDTLANGKDGSATIGGGKRPRRQLRDPVAAPASPSSSYGNQGLAYHRAYFDYDAESDDEDTIAQLASISPHPQSASIATSLFEQMIARLEQELELARAFAQPLSDCVDSFRRMTAELEHGRGLLQACSTFQDPQGSLAGLASELESACKGSAPAASFLATTTNAAEGGAEVSATGSAAKASVPRPLTLAELQHFVPEHTAMGILAPVVLRATGDQTLSADEHAQIAHSTYTHWLHKSVGRMQSYLRGYHKFHVQLWQQADRPTATVTTSVASLPEVGDFPVQAVLTSLQQLLRVRRDLDRARLIVDRVRRREKIKRDLLRCSTDLLCVSGMLGAGFSLRPPPTPSSSVAEPSATGEPQPRKRGRPRRADSISSLPGPPSTPLTPLGMKRLIPAAPAEVTVKLVQGRDKFGKFLRKAPVVVPRTVEAETSLTAVRTDVGQWLAGRAGAAPSAVHESKPATLTTGGGNSHCSTTASQSSVSVSDSADVVVEFGLLGTNDSPRFSDDLRFASGYDSEDGTVTSISAATADGLLQFAVDENLVAEGGGASPFPLAEPMEPLDMFSVQALDTTMIVDDDQADDCLYMIAELPQLLSDNPLD